MTDIEIRIGPNGQLQARRRDGQPLTLDDRQEARRFAEVEEALPSQARIVDRVYGEGSELRAIKVYSCIVEDHLWVIWNRGFDPKDTLAVYYGEELALLRSKTPEDLRAIHRVKLAFPGSRIIQEGAEGREAHR